MSQNAQSLYSALWASADILRSKMDANEYKNYLLGIIFYKYLSDKMLHYAIDQLEEKAEGLKEAQRIYAKVYQDPESHSGLKENLYDKFSYVIEPSFTYSALLEDIHNGRFQLEKLAQGFRDIEQSDEAYANLFQYIDLYSKKLGATPQKQNETVTSIMKALAEVDFVGHTGDILGDAYEYMIGQFASDSGKNAGEFYTPQPVAQLMTKIVMHGKKNKKGFSIYDPAMGSGSLMLNVKKETHESGTVLYFGQEINTSTYNLARMNLILHKVPISNQKLSNADTLSDDWPTDEPTNAAEGKIRQMLLENGHIYAVIGLPANLFFNTSIPTTIIVLRKDYNSRNVLFIDAQGKYEKAKTQHKLTEAHINEILNAYIERKTIDKLSYLASYDEIIENEFNLNIPRYVDTFEPEPEIPLIELSKSMQNTEKALKKAEADLFVMLDNLMGTDSESEKEFTEFKTMLKGKINE